MLYPVAVTIGADSIDLDTIAADVTIRHGRTGYWDQANAATIQITILDVSKAELNQLELGDVLVFSCHDSVAGTDAPRFTGTLTDAAMDTAADTLTLIAVGRLATLSNYTVGLADYPAEAWSARVTRVFSDAGLIAYLVLQAPAAGQTNPMLLARPAEPVRLADYLAELAPMLSGAIADLPDGKILVQAATSRTSSGRVDLDPGMVGYAPNWEKWLPDANIVNLTWGDPGVVVTVQEAGSISQFGPRPLDVDTKIGNATDATAIANLILARSAWPQWAIPAAALLEGLPLQIGKPVGLSSLPPASPHSPWSPILEGWTDTISSDLRDEFLEWSMDLALSDPYLSGLVLAWQDVPSTAAYLWNTINQTVPWHDATELDALTP